MVMERLWGLVPCPFEPSPQYIPFRICICILTSGRSGWSQDLGSRPVTGSSCSTASNATSVSKTEEVALRRKLLF